MTAQRAEYAAVRTSLERLLASQKSMKLATAGGVISPWITAVYFAEHTSFELNFTLEKRGRGMANILALPRVALAVDANDPFAVFAQAEGVARIVTGAAAELALAALRRKVPEIEPLLKGELHVMAVAITQWLVTSFPNGWFPARVVTPSDPPG